MVVVDPLEVIDVDIDEGERYLAELAEQLLAAEPVEGPGQGIVTGLLLGAPTLLAQALAQRLGRPPRRPGLAQPVPHQQMLHQKQREPVGQPAQQQGTIEGASPPPAAIKLHLLQRQPVVAGLHADTGGDLDGKDVVQIRPLLGERDLVLLHPPGGRGKHLERHVLDTAVIVGAEDHLVELVGGLIPGLGVGGVIVAQIESPYLLPLALDPQLDAHPVEMGEIDSLLGLGQGQSQLTEGKFVAGAQLAVDGGLLP
ncbi:hypothetical protein D3C79_638440 [compost metagenome]